MSTAKRARVASGTTATPLSFDGERLRLLDGFVLYAPTFQGTEAHDIAKKCNLRGALVLFGAIGKATLVLARTQDLPLQASVIAEITANSAKVIDSKFIDDCLAQDKRLDISPYLISNYTLAASNTAPPPSSTNSTQPSSSSALSAPPTVSAPVQQTTFVWQWKGDTAWTDYSPTESATIEADYLAKRPQCNLSKLYVVDFKNSVQMRTDQTWRQRAVRRIQSQASTSTAPTSIASTSIASTSIASTSIASTSIPSTSTTSSLVGSSSSTSTKVVTKKGKGVVDDESGLANQAHVLESGQLVYHATLNKTDIVGGMNQNKFYIIQALESDSLNKWWTFNRWGRVGRPGQSALKTFTRKEDAIADFKQKFTDKAAFDFANIANYKPVSGKYRYLEIEDDQDDDTTTPKPQSIVIPPSTLDQKVHAIVSLICDIKIFTNSLIQYEIDVKKMPLGKLSIKLIKEAQGLLKKLEDEILTGKPRTPVIEQYSSDFYTTIPHNFGNTRPPAIKDLSALQAKAALLENLAQLEIANRVINVSSSIPINPVDASYEELKCKFSTLGTTEPEYDLIISAVKNSHGSTHNFKLSVLEIYKVEREGEDTRYAPFQTMHNRRLLWHGSRLSNFAGIIKQGLRIAPPEAPSTGYMYGKGVYFADCVSKSANYCHVQYTNNEGVMLLCEVALGNMAERLHADTNIKLKQGENSCFGLGQYEPNPSANHVMSDGVIFPVGKMARTKHNGTLLYNEFIVYDVCQVKVRYLLRLKWS
eukprot:TRINITY_DN410_c0_g1_i15.p1 TRINITY_DN410_c0_g1~~TRINITY_DN410_c0_g1_i15.p1  ORF type:complete len:760 (+),score=161.86 TRINITY_DN410_c0_g1_i15:47-2326(+)